jgi:hypothetical protein
MDRALLEKPKTINPNSTREESNKKKKHCNTKNEMERCSEEQCGRARRRNRLDGTSN